LTAIQVLADRYASQTDVVSAIELLNEPAGYSSSIDLDSLKQFYYNGWGNVRTDNAYTAVVIHDAFENIQTFWNGFMNTQAGVNDVILDTHIYQIFSDDQVAMSPSDHIATACAAGPLVKGTDKWLVVGEWTGAQTDCAQWLNGLGIGARYDGTYGGASTWHGSCDGKYSGTVDDLSSDDKYNLAHFIEAQLDAYEQHSGWIFWAWKNEAAPEWHFQNLTRAGIIPNPITSRNLAPQCSF
jgi:glucan 1,3-beta-glucosidase